MKNNGISWVLFRPSIKNRQQNGSQGVKSGICLYSVCSFCVCLFYLLLFLVCFRSFRFLITKTRKMEFKNVFIFDLTFIVGTRPLSLRGPRLMWRCVGVTWKICVWGPCSRMTAWSTVLSRLVQMATITMCPMWITSSFRMRSLRAPEYLCRRMEKFGNDIPTAARVWRLVTTCNLEYTYV